MRLKFSRYQKFVVGLLAFLQFSIILDFMIISPIGATIMPDLDIGPQRFGEIVSAYVFSAGISGIVAAGFADRFDRKRFLLFFYFGFIIGTALCALAPNYHLLLLARIVTGLFGGVIGSVVLAINTDLFPFQMPGRVMGVVRTEFLPVRSTRNRHHKEIIMAEHISPNSASAVLTNLSKLLSDLEPLYKDIHAHPELSMRETRTASIAADRLRKAGYEVTTGVGKTGVVGLLRNGEGPTVMLRADMDALPIAENTGLSYASKVMATDAEGVAVPVGHMCGHDMHVAWLIGAATLLSQARDAWKGTLMAVFQPGEETAQGAQAMIDDGLLERFPTPDVVLGQHVMVGPAGSVASSAGPITSAADSLQIRLFGRGAHGSMPQASIDPVVMAASVVMRLQTVVSREIAATDAAVLTVGVLQAGTKENVIPDDAVIKLNVRTFDAGVRKHVLAAIERIVNAEAEASGAPRKPEITPLDRYPLNVNDETASNRIAEAFRAYFHADRVKHTGPAPASEDFGCFGTAWHVPSVFWFVGGNDPRFMPRPRPQAN